MYYNYTYMIIVKITNINEKRIKTCNDMRMYLLTNVKIHSMQYTESDFASTNIYSLDSYRIFIIDSNDNQDFMDIKEHFKNYCWHEVIFTFINI